MSRKFCIPSGFLKVFCHPVKYLLPPRDKLLAPVTAVFVADSDSDSDCSLSQLSL